MTWDFGQWWGHFKEGGIPVGSWICSSLGQSLIQWWKFLQLVINFKYLVCPHRHITKRGCEHIPAPRLSGPLLCVCVCVWCTTLSSHCQNASQTPRALCPGVTNRWKGVFEMTSRGKSDRGSHHGERALLGLRFLMSSKPVDLVGGAQQSDTAKQRDRRTVCKGFAYCSFSQLHRCFSETSFIKVILWICWNLFSPPLSQDSRVSVLRLLLWCLWKTGCSKWCKPLYTN